ncbi:MAG TPA: 50S ribosomal protein L11 methyltransferase [Verrucomicrobiae bacterium]
MKTNKPLWRVSVTTSLEAEDAVTEMLAELFGAAAAAYFNLETGVSTVSVFRDQKLDSPKVRAEIAAGLKRIENCGLKIGAGKIEIAKVKREDWKESWKRHFHPMEIGKSLLVKPSWSKKRPRKNQAVVILDPGLSFGTGQHPTTSFCLSEIVRQSENRTTAREDARPTKTKSFLDIGTGSGILAISAAKLGYQPVHAFDFDPESVRVAKENTRKNRVDAKLKPTRGDVTKLPLKPARQYDLVCANLISNLLIAEKQRIVNRLKPDGILVLAGILAVEFGEVERAFMKLKLKLVAKRVENEWCSGSFCFV